MTSFYDNIKQEINLYEQGRYMTEILPIQRKTPNNQSILKIWSNNGTILCSEL